MLLALIIMKDWKVIGYDTVLFLAGLHAIPQDLHDADKVECAHPLQRFRYDTLPLLSQTMLFVIVVAVIGSFQDFDQVFTMT